MFGTKFRAHLSGLAFVIVLSMSTSGASQTLPAPVAVTAPAQLKSTSVDNLQKFSIPMLYSTRIVSGSTWSPDGRRVAFVANISGRDNLWLVPAAGGWPMQLTISDQRQDMPSWSPDGRWIAYMSDHNGDELWDIYLVSPDNGEVVNLTAAPDNSSEMPTWSPDGRFVAYITRAKNSPSFEIEYVEVKTRRTVRVTHDTPPQLGNFSPLWSPDGRRLAYTEDNASGKDSNIFVYDLATQQATCVTPHAGDKVYSAAEFSPDGQTLLVTSNAVNGYDNVGLLDLASQQIRWVTEDRWEIHANSFSRDGQRIYWQANVDGREALYSRAIAGGPVERLPLEEGVNSFAGNPSPWSRDGKKLLFEHAGATSPYDLYVYDIATKQTTQLTNSLVGGLRAESMVRPVLVHYPSQDGKFTISAWAYVPHNLVRNGKYPAIVYIHGGPAAQSMDSFNRFVQYMCNQGYLVIAPNYRGGTGYGQPFQEANRKDAGGEELNDVIGAAEFLQRSGYVDAKKLIVMGGSYGGYLTMMAVTKRADLWAAGVPIVPFVNWFTEFENEDPQLQEYDRLFMGDPVKDKALWQDRSPINFIHNVKAPLLILAGENDPRCPPSEAQQVADAVTKQGGVAELKVYANEGHGFARVENMIDAYQRAADFLKAHVPSPGCGCSVDE